jgi:hypothetical protein
MKGFELQRWIGGIGLTVVLIASLWATPSFGINFRVQSETIGQGYQIITLNGDIIKRHRLNQFLSLNAFDMTGDGSNRISFSSSFRLDSDFGISDRDMDRVDQLRNHDMALMFGYINVNRWANMIDLRLGRQLLIDDMDFTMMDGLRTVVHTPWHVGVEVYAGAESKNAGYIGTITSTQLESDGSGGGSDVVDDEVALVFGGSVLLENLTNHHGKIGYRRIQTMDSDVDGERVFANYHVRVLPQLHIAASAAWDFVIADVSDVLATIRAPGIANLVDIELSYWRLIPTFEGSSIFNVFAIEPMNDIDARVRFHLGPGISTYVGGYLRLFRNDPDNNDEGVEDVVKDMGARAGGQVRFGRRGHLGLDVTYQQGYGDLTILDFGGAYNLHDNQWQLTGRLTTVIFDDELQENLNGTSFGVQLGARYEPVETARIHLMTELNTNRFETIQFRVLGMVELDFWL